MKTYRVFLSEDRVFDVQADRVLASFPLRQLEFFIGDVLVAQFLIPPVFGYALISESDSSS